MDFPGRSVGKESACNARDSPGEGIRYSLQDSGLENSMDCIVHGVAKSRTLTELLALLCITAGLR